MVAVVAATVAEKQIGWGGGWGKHGRKGERENPPPPTWKVKRIRCSNTIPDFQTALPDTEPFTRGTITKKRAGPRGREEGGSVPYTAQQSQGLTKGFVPSSHPQV